MLRRLGTGSSLYIIISRPFSTKDACVMLHDFWSLVPFALERSLFTPHIGMKLNMFLRWRLVILTGYRRGKNVNAQNWKVDFSSPECTLRGSSGILSPAIIQAGKTSFSRLVLMTDAWTTIWDLLPRLISLSATDYEFRQGLADGILSGPEMVQPRHCSLFICSFPASWSGL